MQNEDRAEIDRRIQTVVAEARKELKRGSVLIYTIVAVFVLSWIILAFLATRGMVSPVTMNYIFVSFGIILFLPLMAGRFSKRQNRALNKLASFDDIHALGPLLSVKRHVAHWKTNEAIYAALTRLLLNVKASDRGLLDDVDYNYLLESLNGCRIAISAGNVKIQYEPYYLSVLKAMEQIGDEKALRHVEEIVKIRPKSAPAKRIHAAAEECLLALRDRATKSGHRLLRPVEEQQEGAHLLRPIEPGAQTAAQSLLLRPDMKNE